jgi:hypothetical protein
VLVAVGTAAFALPWLLATAGAFTQLRNASRYTTPAAPWRELASLLEPALGYATARSIIGALAGLTGLALIALLFRRGLPPSADTTVGRAAAAMSAFAIGWLLTAPYILPWYDALAWAPLALAAASFLDRVLLVHTATLAIAFLPGRDVPLDQGAAFVNRVLHSGLSPVVLTVLIVVTAALAMRRRHDSPSPVSVSP